MRYSHGQVRGLFERIAHRYDLLNRLLSAGVDRRWRRRMVRSCSSFETPRILDLGTGTGDVLKEVDRLAPRLRVGVDLSREMLSRAALKLHDEDCFFIEGAAETLPLKSGTFDLVLVAFGVRNFSDRQAGLHEIGRVLDRNGEIRILEFSQPRGNFRALYGPYFRSLLPRIGGWISGSKEAYEYLPRTVLEFPSREVFGEELRQAGFSDIRWETLTAGIVTLYSARVGGKNQS